MITTEIEKIEEIESKAMTIIGDAESLVVNDQASYERAGKFLTDFIAPMKKQIRDTFDTIVEKAYAAHKEATTKRKMHLDPVAQAETCVKGKMQVYYIEQKRIDEEKRRKAQEAADREEKKRIAKKEEQARIEREKAAAKQREADRLVAEGKEEEAREAILAAEKATEKAEKREEEADNVTVSAKPVAPSIQKVAGIKMRNSYSFKVVNADLVPSVFKIVDEKKIGDIVRRMGKDAEEIVPGIKVIETVTASR